MSYFNHLLKSFAKHMGYDLASYPVAKQAYTGQKLAFVHIAKSGGISVDNALRKAIATPHQRRIDRDFTLAASVASFGKAINSAADSEEFSRHHAKNLANILAYYLALNWQYVSGHVTVNSSILNKYSKEYGFVTVLRDPVDRYVSNYIYNKLTNRNKFMLPNKYATVNLADEAMSIMGSERGWQMANTNTMFITGRYPTDQNSAKSMSKDFLSNLNQFSVVGFLDALPKFAKKCSEITERDITIPTLNSVSALQSDNEKLVKNTLYDFFAQDDIQKKLHQLCFHELNNYNAAKDAFS